ncbi:28S ribosomal protein S29, mitochondrial-like isoform X1 [Ctenocephalides felis]|uniref:28S ribosomal protein S29, mitochondrial-like isoform X1 n=2 Tax=Ctenocephalides felis TaxID=7515 RepID=UPI000E6E5711|nr:28S ribosomal protein S29, mitochondrial-like isoform X1 [Ctenocephalides felis]
MNFSVLRRTGPVLRQCVASPMSTLAEPAASPNADFRTLENNPINHNRSHCGHFYTMQPSLHKQLFNTGGFPKSFQKQVKTFNEACLMVREPTIEIMEYMEKMNYSKPALRFVMYGKLGCGKSLALAHLIHYAYEKKFIIVHVPWVPNWFIRPKEYNNSTIHEGFMDLPIDAAAWLFHFQTQNSTLLKELDLKTSKDYVWSKREVTPKDSPLMAIVEHGINRVKYASECISVLFKELKQQSTEGRCKTFVAIDGYNALWHTHSIIKGDNKQFVPPAKVTITTPFLDITNFDWCNGLSVVIVDQHAVPKESQESHLPRYLLGKEGFEHLDPFIPVEIKGYNDKEFASVMQYYRDRLWLQTQDSQAEKELHFMSGCNPYRLMEMCGPL